MVNVRVPRLVTRLLAVAGVLVLLAGAGRLAYRKFTGAGGSTAVPTITIAREAFQRRVTADGTLVAAQATPVTAPPQARERLKISWLAPDGSRVEKGQVVVRFDPSEFEKQLADSKSDEAAAQAKIAKERVQTGAVLRGRDRTAELAEAELERTREFQAKDSEIFSRNQIIESEVDEGLSTARKDHAAKARNIESEVSRGKLGLLDIEKRSAEQYVDQAQAALASLEVTAPHDGILVLKRGWRGQLPRVGDTVWRGQSLAEIPLLDEMEAEVFVLEADAGGLAEGIPATLVIEAHPEVTYQAKIQRVDKLAKPRNPKVPIQYFGVTLALERTDKSVMKPGQRVRATLIFDDEQAIVVPRQSVFEVGDKSVVYRKDGSGFQAVEVKLGSSTPGRVVVEEGLGEGDVIALRDPTRPADQAGEKDQENGKGQHGPGVSSR